MRKIKLIENIKNERIHWVFIYSVLFFLFTLIVFLNFILNGKSFVWSADGYPQHYKNLMMIRTFYSDFFGNLSGGLPIYNFNLGFGADVFNTLTYYGFFDPINMISVFFPLKFTEYLYDFLVILRFYLSGLSFVFMCIYFEKKKVNSIIGAFIYLASGYFFFYGPRHPFFLNVTIYLPILIIGLDMILKKKKPYFFIFGITFLGFGGFYFLYMATLMLFIYANIRFFELNKERKGRVKKYFSDFLTVLKFYLIGVGISMFAILPNVLIILSSKRGEALNVREVLFSGKYLPKLLEIFDVKSQIAFLGITFFTLISGLISYWKHRKGMFYLTLISIIGIGMNFIGVIMSGFIYYSDRWYFGTSLLISYIFVEQLEHLLERNHFRLITTLLVIYNAVLLSCSVLGFGGKYILVSLAVLDVTYILLYFPGIKKTMRLSFVCMIVTALVAVKSCYTYSLYVKAYKSHGMYEDMLASNAVKFSNLYADEEVTFYRLDGVGIRSNEGVIYDLKTYSVYWSLINDNVIDFFLKLDNFNMNKIFTITGIDNRTIIGALLSNRYQILDNSGLGRMSYGYEKDRKLSESRTVYKNKYFIPFGFTYDNYVLYNEFEPLFSLDKESNMLDTVALEKDVEGIKRGETKRYCIEESFDFVEKGKKKFELYPKVEGEKEVFVYVTDLESEKASDELFVKGREFFKSQVIKSPKDRYYFRNDYLINLGHAYESKYSFRLMEGKFKEKVTKDNIKLFSRSLTDYADRVNKRKEDVLEDVKFGTNVIEGRINLKQSRILAMGIPYEKGWKAFVDGKEVEILKGNYFFSCIKLEPGEHKIIMKYRTPGLKVSFVISILSVTILIIMIVMDKRRSREC